MYQTIAISCAQYFGISALIYKFSKSLQALDESIIYDYSNKTILINYMSLTFHFYFLVSLLKITF